MLINKTDMEEEKDLDSDPFIQQPNNHTLYLRPEFPPIEHFEVPKEPWYRRFENKRRKK